MEEDLRNKISHLTLKGEIVEEFLKESRYSEALLKLLQKDINMMEKKDKSLVDVEYKIKVLDLIAGCEKEIKMAENLLQNINLELRQKKSKL